MLAFVRLYILVTKYLEPPVPTGRTTKTCIGGDRVNSWRYAFPLFSPAIVSMRFGLSEDAMKQAEVATAVLFGLDVRNIVAADVIAALGKDPRLVFVQNKDDVIGESLTKISARLKHTRSRGKLLSSRLIFLLLKGTWNR